MAARRLVFERTAKGDRDKDLSRKEQCVGG